MNRLLSTATGASLATLGLAGAAVAFARRVVLNYPDKTFKLLAVDEKTVLLQAHEKTLHNGTFGLYAGDGDTYGHIRVGEVLTHDRQAKTVEREIIATSRARLGAHPKSVWEGDIFDGPGGIDPRYQEVSIDLPGGTSPAWVIEPPTPNDEGVWAIHVHGIRTTRLNALRTVVAARQLGYTSLVPSFRGDGEGPPMPHNVSTLGQTEWRDIDAAISYALEHGATSIVLFGWSMGASVILLAGERSTHRDKIRGFVLVSPATDWRATIYNVAKRMHLPLPGLCMRLASFALTNPLLSRAVGLSEPIDLDQLDWTKRQRLSVPALVIHSAGDKKIPLELSRAFAAANDGLVTVFVAGDAAHAWEFNVGPEKFTQAIVDWADATL
jgi:pimeloyl-ACP methyl ester carboxylesterase